MYITEHEVTGLLQFAVRHTATKLKVQNADWKAIDELLEEINAISSEIHSALVTFIDAYLDWYRFHKRIHDAGKEGQLDPDEQDELHALIKNRDATRNAILKLLGEIQ
jgi:hypothetical protein